MFFKRKKDDDVFTEMDDMLIVFDDEQKTSDIRRITNITDESVIVNGVYNVPYSDCEITNSSEGRNFFYRAPSQSIKETKRLAQLEQSMVLSKITNYREPEPDTSGNLTQYLLIGVILVAFLMFGISSCSTT